MVKIIFIEPDGAPREVEVATGQSLMQAAVEGGIRGIDALCGGACMCATCQVHWVVVPGGALPSPELMEQDLLSVSQGGDVDANSRLSCQIPVTDALQGSVFRVALKQG